MSDSNKSPIHWGRQGAASGTNKRWWQRAWNPGRLRDVWTRIRPVQRRSSAGSPPRIFPDRFLAGTWMLALWVILLCLPVGGLILGYIRRPAAGTAGISSSSPPGSSSDSGSKIPKPAPGRPMLPVSQAPPPTTTLPAPPPIAPVTQPALPAPQTPAAPMSAPALPPPAPAPPSVPGTAKTPFVAVTYPARHDKHFGDECSGQLTLNSNELAFSCPGNPGEGVQVAINQIDEVDDNGIRLISGKKYHFSIPGMSKSAERTLFAEWLSRVR